MDYRKTAQEILNHVGGSKNIVSAAHCATRLRLVIADNSKAEAKEAAASETKTASNNTKTTSSEEVLNAPVNGKIIPNDQIADDTFAAEVLGKTVAIEPADGIITAPCDGEIVSIFDTGHAVYILTDGSAELRSRRWQTHPYQLDGNAGLRRIYQSDHQRRMTALLYISKRSLYKKWQSLPETGSRAGCKKTTTSGCSE